MGSLLFYKTTSLLFSNATFFARLINTSSLQLALKGNFSKQGKIFNKLMLGGSKKKRKFIFDESQSTFSEKKLTLGQHLKYNKENSRRIAVLNTVFMKHISDLLVSGNIGVDVLEKGLEISRVSMNPDFSQLNIFWGCNNEKNIVELENTLPNVGYSLRHELSQIRVVGIVPRIVFIKDKHYTDGAKVDYLLKIADFGDDHVPVGHEPDFNVNSPTSARAGQVSCKSSTLVAEEENNNEEQMPPMRNDVFNLDHQFIMNKILKKMQKSRAIHRFEPNLVIQSDGKNITEPNIPETEIMTKEERKEALAKFILNRRILHEKKRHNKHKTDKEMFIAGNEDCDEEEEEGFEVEDYIDEDYEEKEYQR